MAKVLVERERLGGRNDRKGRAPRSPGDLPKKQSMKRAHKDRKSLNENLSPLKRFIESKVGMHWDRVYSEISQYLKPSNAVQQHVRDHIWDFVNRNVMTEGKVVLAIGRYHSHPTELQNGELYICSKTGILKKYKRKLSARKAYDRFGAALVYISSAKCRLELEGNEVYRIYEDPLSKKWTIRQLAKAAHAKLDFEERFLGFSQKEVRSFFEIYKNRVPLKHPYFANYLTLIAAYDAAFKLKAQKNASQYRAGAKIEISEDNGLSWSHGVINRVQASGGLKPTLWITSDNKNICVSGYSSKFMVRLGK